MGNALTDELNRKREALKNVLHRSPREVGAIAVNHFKSNFRAQGFDGQKWPKRKREPRKRQGRAILIKSARLLRSIRVIEADVTRIIIGSDVPYAQIHNEGGTMRQAARSEIFTRNRNKRTKRFTRGKTAGRGFTYKPRVITIPARKFIGESKELTAKVNGWYERNINKALKIK